MCSERELLAIAHTILDDGRDYCPSCEEVVEAGLHCGECGAVLHELPRPDRKCSVEDCGYTGRARFCPRDGTRIIPQERERVDSGQTTWNDEIRNTWATIKDSLPEPAETELERQRRLIAQMPE